MCGKPTLIVGAGEIGHRLEHYLERLPAAGDDPGRLRRRPAALGRRVGERRRRLCSGRWPSSTPWSARPAPATSMFAFGFEPDVALRRLVRRCEERELTMAVVPRLFDDATNRMKLEHVGGHPRVRAPPGRPQGLGVRDQARLRPPRRRGRAAPALAGDRRHRARGAPLLTGAGAVPPAAGRSRRPGLRRAQVPLDAPGPAGRRPAEALRRSGPRSPGRRGRGPQDAGRALHPRLVAGRAAAADQRPARPDEPGRAAARAPGAGRGVRRPRPSLRRAPPGPLGDHRLVAGQPARARAPRSPTEPSTTTGTSRTGPCGST